MAKLRWDDWEKRGDEGWYGEAYCQSLYELAEKFKPRQGLEIGRQRGCSTLAFLLGSSRLHLTSIDPEKELWWRGKFIVDPEEILRERGVIDRHTFIQGYSPQAVPERRLDLVYIDGDHSYEAVKADIAATWPLLEKGGIMAFDDYGTSAVPGVREAIDEFAETHGQAIHAIKGHPYGGVYFIK